MADPSTGLVVTAGALSIVDQLLNDGGGETILRIAVGTVLAAYLSAGLNKAIPGLGTGAGLLLLFGAVLRSGPRIAPKLLTGK